MCIDWVVGNVLSGVTPSPISGGGRGEGEGGGRGKEEGEGEEHCKYSWNGPEEGVCTLMCPWLLAAKNTGASCMGGSGWDGGWASGRMSCRVTCTHPLPGN